MPKEMSRRKAPSYANVQYSPLEGINGDDFDDSQFDSPPSTIPWKAIILAVLLCVGGLFLLLVGSCIVGGVIDSKYEDRMWPVIILGCLMFVPGAYHVRVAYCAYHQISGYSFDDIPEFE